jgi:hypothetical protein
MTQEDKQLLLVDLCARLHYGVLCEDMEGKTRPLFGITPTQHFIVTLDNATDGTNGLKFCTIDSVKPYLRPMSSMTEEEEIEYDATFATIKMSDGHYDSTMTYKSFDWLNSHHFDYRGLIEKGLAIKVTEENNPYEA